MYTFLMIALSLVVLVVLITALSVCVCGCKNSNQKSELVGTAGVVKIRLDEEVPSPTPTTPASIKRASTQNSQRSLPEIPQPVGRHDSGDTASEIYATVNLDEGNKAVATTSTNRERPYEHEYAKLQTDNHNVTVEITTDEVSDSGIQIDEREAVPSAAESVLIPASVAISGQLASSDELPYITPPSPRPAPDPVHFSGDSTDSAKGYTSISVREPLSNIRAQAGRARTPHYATVSDDSDEMYAAIEEASVGEGSDTYAQIAPEPRRRETHASHAPLVVQAEITHHARRSAPPEIGATSNSTHSRQASMSSCSNSTGALGSPKPEKRQANSPLPPPPPQTAHASHSSHAPQPHSSHASQPHSSHAPQPHSSHAPQPHSSHAPQPHSSHAPQPHSSHAPQPQSSHAPQPHSSHAPQPHSSHAAPQHSSHAPQPHSSHAQQTSHGPHTSHTTHTAHTASHATHTSYAVSHIAQNTQRHNRMSSTGDLHFNHDKLRRSLNEKHQRNNSCVSSSDFYGCNYPVDKHRFSSGDLIRPLVAKELNFDIDQKDNAPDNLYNSIEGPSYSDYSSAEPNTSLTSEHRASESPSRNVEEMYAKVMKKVKAKEEAIKKSKDISSNDAPSNLKYRTDDPGYETIDRKQSVNHGYETIARKERKSSDKDPGYETVKDVNKTQTSNLTNNNLLKLNNFTDSGPNSIISSDAGYEHIAKSDNNTSDSDPNYEVLRNEPPTPPFSTFAPNYKVQPTYSIVNKRFEKPHWPANNNDETATDPNYESMSNDPLYTTGSESDPNYESVRPKDPNYESVNNHDPNYESLRCKDPKYESVRSKDSKYDSVRSKKDPNYESVKYFELSRKEPPYEKVHNATMESSGIDRSDSSAGYEKINVPSNAEPKSSINGADATVSDYFQV